MKFFPKKAKTERNAVKVAAVEGARRGRGLFAPYSDWETDAGVSDYEKIAGRLLADRDFRYAYPAKTAVELTDALGATARHDYDTREGTHRVRDFSGRVTKTYYFMRHDAAYLGKVRKVMDGRKRDLVDFRYDKATGRPVRVTDRLGNRRILEYDADGNCVKLSRRAGWSLAEKPVRSFAYDRQGRLVGVSELDENGNAVRTTKLAYGKTSRPVRIADGCKTVTVAYGPSGFPVSLKDDFSVVAFAYDRYNRPVSATDPYGVVTVRTYADHGGVARIERRDGTEVLASLSVAYDGNGQPVSVTDQDGITTACDRDALGRIVKERYADDTEVAYGYDRIGRLAKVVDENGHEITFGWDGFGLSSRLTAAGQLTAVKRDADGLVAEVASSVTGRVDRIVRRVYDQYDRVTEISYAKDEVETFSYDKWGRLVEHTRGKRTESYSYDHFGRLVKKVGGGVVCTYAYDAWGHRTRRTEVGLGGGAAQDERRVYDRAGNMVRKTVRGRTTTFLFDGANQLVASTVDGRTTRYAYDAAGRLVREGDRSYRYGYLDKVLGVTEGGRTYTYDCHVDGQLARADYGDGRTEDFSWDGLALVRRNGECFVNEPHVGGGAPVASSKGTTYFNDLLGTTIGVREGRKTPRYSAAALTAFGAAANSASGPSVAESSTFFTGKPHVDGLGRAFLFRNYRAPLAKWQTADPLGYPDGWNQLAYCGNAVTKNIDFLGAATVDFTVKWSNFEFQNYYYASYVERIFGDMFDTDCMQLTGDIWQVISESVLPRVEDQIDAKVQGLVRKANSGFGNSTTHYWTSKPYSFTSACWALGDGTVTTASNISYSWYDSWSDGVCFRYYVWSASVFVDYSDVFKDPLDIGIESPFANAYSYYHTWKDVPLASGGVVIVE